MASTNQQVVKGYCQGVYCGDYQPIRFADGRIGWQAVNAATGALMGFVVQGRHHGPYGMGNCTWELCEETPEHTRSLRLSEGQPWDTARFTYRRQ